MRTVFLFLMMCFAACGPKQAAPVVTDTTTVTVAMSHVDMKSGDALAVPDALSASVHKALKNAGVTATHLAVADYPAQLNKRTLPNHRAAALVDANGASALLVLVEAKATFYSQLRGQNRWVVNVEATAVSPKSPENALVRRFDVPVFLNYTHQREAEALVSAGPMISRRVERLVRDALTLAETP